MTLQENLQILKKIYPKISKYNWLLIGSTNLALQGIDVDAKDIDIYTDEKNAYLIGEALNEYVIEPVHYKKSEQITSHYGKFMIDGKQLEIIGTTDNEIIENHKLYKKVGELDIPLCNLNRELEAYTKLGRTEKADIIQKKIRELSSDKP